MPGPLFPRWSGPGALTRQISSHVRQISPDKDVNFCYTTAAFTLSPESRASLCGANLPGDWALYAVSVRRLIALHSGFLRTDPRGSASRSKSGIFDLPSANTFVNVFNTLTGFTYRGLAPHKFTPPGGGICDMLRAYTSGFSRHRVSASKLASPLAADPRRLCRINWSL
jgi:hypothetical protein